MALALMRRHRRWLYIFLWLVIAAFIILYIPAFQGDESGMPGETVVSVGEQPISVGEFRRTYFRQRQVYDRLYQGRLEDAMLRQIQQQALESLVNERLVELEADRLGVSVSDDAVAHAIATSPENQDDDRFIGVEELRRRLDLQGLSEQQYAESVRRRLLSESLQTLVGSAAAVSDAEIEQELARRNQRARFEYVLASVAPFREAAQPTEQQIQARFEAQQQAYEVPEKRVLSYAVLAREALRPQVVVSDTDISIYYEDHREDFRQEEQACAQHILLKVKQGEAPDGHPEEEARQIAEDLLARLNAGADFAALARESSEDAGSAQNGGDLGCFPPGQMVREFDDAVFALEPGQTSAPVRSSFGYHIIRLQSKQESTVPALAQVKERIRELVLERKLGDLADQKAQAVAEALTRGTSLEEAAQAQGLSVHKSSAFARSETPDELPSPFLVARAFGMKQGEVEKSPYPLPQGGAFFALAEILPAHPPALDEVREKVRADIVEETIFEQAHALAAGVKAKAEAIGLERAAAAAGLLRKETPRLVSRGQSFGELGSGFALEQAVFTLPEKTLGAPVRVTSGWVVLRVLERTSAEAATLSAERARAAASLREQKRSELFQAFLAEARERYPITRNPKAFQRAIGELY